MQVMANSIRYTNYAKNGQGNYIQNSPSSFVAQQTDDILSGEFGTPDASFQPLYGLDPRGIWKQAHAITHGYGIDRFIGVEPQDAYNDIVVAAMELTVERPDIIEKSAAYLLVAAANRVRNRYAKLYQTYFVKKGVTVCSLDSLPDYESSGTDNEDHTDFIAQITYTYDYEMAQTVQDIVASLDAESRTVAGYLYDGYKASDIARLTGMYPMQVSRIVKGLRTQLESALL